MKKTTLIMIALWVLVAIVSFRHWIEIINMELGLPLVLGMNLSFFVFIAMSEGMETNQNEIKKPSEHSA